MRLSAWTQRRVSALVSLTFPILLVSFATGQNTGLEQGNVSPTARRMELAHAARAERMGNPTEGQPSATANGAAAVTFNNTQRTDFGVVEGGTSAPLQVVFSFAQPVTIGRIEVLTMGASGQDFADEHTGTCTINTSYSAGESCTVDVTFRPMFAGRRMGAVVMTDDLGRQFEPLPLEATANRAQLVFRAGRQKTIAAGFDDPEGVAVDGSENAFIVDAVANTLSMETRQLDGSYVGSTLDSSLKAPFGVALDGAGNIFVSDSGTGNVYKYAAGTYTRSTIASGFQSPGEIAVDGGGNVFVADYANVDTAAPAGLYKVPHSGLGYGRQSLILEGYSYAVAVDGSGNVFGSFASKFEGDNNLVYRFSGGSSEGKTAVGAGFVSATGLAIDPAGNLYIADNGGSSANGVVYKQKPAGGNSYTTSILLTNVNSPEHVFIDASGNLYIPDYSTGNVFEEDYSDAPVLSGFGLVDVGSTSDSQTVALENIGNETMAFSGTGWQNPSVPNGYTLSGSTCPIARAEGQPSTLASGASCTLAIAFRPIANGVNNGSVALTESSDKFTQITRSIGVSGTGTGGKAIATMSVPAIRVTGTAVHPELGGTNLVVNQLTDDAGAAANCTLQPTAGKTTNADTCSLRDALLFAASAGSGNITFDSTVFAAAQTITLSNGTLTIPTNTTVTGPTSGSGSTLTNLVNLNGHSLYTVFTVNSGVSGASISGLAIESGKSTTTAGGITNAGTLKVSNTTLTGNQGGGIYNTGTLTVTNSTFSGNSGGNSAGGIYSSGTLAVTYSTFSGNYTQNAGGAIELFGGTLTLDSSTLSQNGAAIFGGGIYIGGGAVTVTNTVASSNSGGDIVGSYTDNGGNVVGSSSISLAALGEYGGATETMVPTPGSPAICAGLATNIPVGVSTDQRGLPNTNTTYPGYSAATPCVDSGAVQSNYALSFTTSPSESQAVGIAFTPLPVVTLTESGKPATSVTSTVTMTDLANDLQGTTSANLAGAEATFSNLYSTNSASGDVLTATLVVTSTINLTAQPATVVDIGGTAELLLSVEPNGTFTQGSTGELQFQVSNLGEAFTTGKITVTDTLPTGYTISSAGGDVWTCSGATTVVCTSTRQIQPNSYTNFDLSVNIPANSPTSVTDSATVSGGGVPGSSTVTNTFSVQQVPIGFAATAGNFQSAEVNTAFATNLAATVTDAGGVGVPGVNVTFAAPGSGPSGTFSGNSTVTTNASGVATASVFTANNIGGGPYLVSASYAGGSSQITTSFSLTNVAVIPTTVVVTAPANATFGQPMNFTVLVRDQFGNLDTSYMGTLHFTSSDPTALLPANATLTGGVGTFPVEFNTSGNQTVTATDMATSTLTATSSPITVSVPNLVVNVTTDDAGLAANCSAQPTPSTTTNPDICSLRDALIFAVDAKSASISFDSTVFASAETITLENGTLTIPSRTTLTGPTAGSGSTLSNLVTVNGAALYPVFTVDSGTSAVSLSNLTIANGKSTTAGGGISNAGSLTVSNSAISGNQATGIYNTGTLTLNDSTVSGNIGGDSAGGIYSSGSLTVSNSTISGNSSSTSGGGILADAGTVTLASATISKNSAVNSGAGLYVEGGTASLSNTVVSGNTGATDITGSYTNAGGNVVASSTIDLASLALSGGITQTMVPLPGSTAICAGNANTTTSDQRGLPIDPNCPAGKVDAGAVQSNYALSFTASPSEMQSVGVSLTPTPVVELKESGSPATFTTASISLTDSASLLTGANVIALSAGSATFSGISLSAATAGDTLTATLALTSTLRITAQPASMLTTETNPVTLSPTSLAFATTTVGTSSGSQTVVMTNSGSAALSIASIAVTGANASSFVFANSCGTSLAAGANCTIHGHFAPTAGGALAAAVTITDNAIGSPQTVALSGTGVEPPVTLSAASLTFGSVNVGAISGSQTVTMTNTGTAALTIGSIAVTGANASSFVFANSCGASLAVGAICTIHGHFAPAMTGALAASITITDSAAGSPQTIKLSGTGLPPLVTLSASSLAFGSTTVGSISASQTVIVTNTGTAALTIGSIAVTGTNASQFVFANTCGTSLAVGASCSIHGHFQPTSAGAKTAAVTITDSALSSPQSIALSGTGVAQTTPVTLSATSLAFGTTKVGTLSVSQSVTMTNAGTTTLTITSIAVTGANANQFVFANTCGTSLAIGASCTIHGHFQPTATGAMAAAITITDNAAGSPQSITLSGTGD